MEKRLSLQVPAEMDGKTVREVALKGMHLSSTRLKKAKRLPRGILLNGEEVYVNRLVRAGDTVSVTLEDPAPTPGLVPTEGEIDVRYEDPWLRVICKPAHMPVHPSAGHAQDTLANLAAARWGGVFRPVNRLDAGTSGLMVVARDAHVHALLSRSLHTEDFVREYLAVTQGEMPPGEGVVDAPIARVPGSALKRCVSAEGQPARTHYRVLRSGGGTSLVSLTLETGRTHQIRVHLAHLGYPLVGDFLYGTEERERITRPALHASRLRLRHPITGEWICVEAELPQDMLSLLEKAQSTENGEA